LRNCKANRKLLPGCLLIILIFSSLWANAYSHKKVILLVDKDLQPDSNGYNFVNDFAKNVYSWIQNGQITLWDSPEKKTVLSFADLKRLEARSMSNFSRLSDIYIYEYWTSHARKTSFTITGFSMNGSTFKGGKDVIYGFIEFNNTLRNLLENTPVYINANGNSGTTLYSALMDMGFNYTLIYFGNAPLIKNKSSDHILAETFNPRKKLLNKIPAKQTRLIEYGWDTSLIEQRNISSKIITILENFFNSNPQEFFNYGGDEVYSFLKDVPVDISDIHIIETWTKDKSGKIYFTPQYLVMYAKETRLQPIPFKKLGDWKLQYGDVSLTAFLSGKNFPYQIRKINDTDIPDQLAQSYKDALFANSWNRILKEK